LAYGHQRSFGVFPKEPSMFRPAVAVCASLVASLAPLTAPAGGFALIGQSAATAGSAYAGASALAGGVDTVWYNPAGMVFLDGPAVSASVDLLFPQSDFDDRGSTNVLGAPRRGSTAGGDEPGAVPAAYLVAPVTPGFALGVALNAPFGQATEYDDDFVGRYEARLSELTTLNLGLSAAARVTDWLAVGGGVDFFYAETRLSSAIDFGAVCLGVVGPGCLAAGLAPETADGQVTLDGDGVSASFNLGVMARFEGARAGLSFRGPVTVTLDGDADFDAPPQAAGLTAGGAFVDTGIASELRFPASLSVGLEVDATERLTLLGQAIWTDWSVVDSIVVAYDNPAQPDTVLRSDWRDAAYLAVGARYRATDALVVRLGLGYDQTPVPDRTRTPRLPGADTVSIAAGLGYQVNGNLTVDAAYQHFFFDDASSDLSDPASGRLVGDYDNASDVLSLQLTYRF
jgi:long-chain fatty acid transport protein